MRTALYLLVFLPLAACGLLDTSVDVTRVHTLPPDGGGQSIRVVIPADHVNDPLSAASAARIGDALARHGYRVLAADSGPSSAADRLAIPSWRHLGCHVSRHTVPTYTPYYNGKKWLQAQTGTRIEEDRLCRYVFELTITSHDHARQFYHGRADATVGFDSLASVLPTLIDGLFDDFPGISGTQSRAHVAN